MSQFESISEFHPDSYIRESVIKVFVIKCDLDLRNMIFTIEAIILHQIFFYNILFRIKV